ncbi:MAG: DUF6356 family protein [Pseudomonadota bacterium]
MRTPTLTRLFLTHPRTVGESYVQHMGVAFRMCATMLKLACAAAIHGMIPALHERTVSDQIITMAETLKARR